MKFHILFLISVLAAGCAGEREFPAVKKLSEYKQTEFAATPQEKLISGKNTVYSVPLLLAWQEVKKESGGDVKIDESNPSLESLNSSTSWKNTLEKGEYQSSATVDSDGSIKAQAELSKALPLKQPLKDYGTELKFDGEAVKSFGLKYTDYDFFGSTRILYYKDDTEFIVKLIPEDPEHEILLYMPNKKYATMQHMLDAMAEKIEAGKTEFKQYEKRWKFGIEVEGDEILIPKINFNIETNYTNIEGSTLDIKGKKHMIEEAWQRTAFMLDELGAEVESEAEMETTTEEMPVVEEKPHPKKLRFDKPFFVVLKRNESHNPYFAMWVENTELMLKQ